MDSRLITLGKAADAVRRFNVRLLNFLPTKPLTNKREIERLKDRLLQFFKKYGEAAAKAINTFFDAVELFKREDYAPQCKEVYYLSYSTRKVMKRLKAQFTDTDLFTTYEDNEVTFFKALLPPANKVVAQREWKTQLRLLPNKRKSVEVLARNVIAYLQGGTADYEEALERFFSTHTVKAVVADDEGIRDWGLGNGKVKVEGEGERWTDNAFDYGAGNGDLGKLVKYGGMRQKGNSERIVLIDINEKFEDEQDRKVEEYTREQIQKNRYAPDDETSDIILPAGTFEKYYRKHGFDKAGLSIQDVGSCAIAIFSSYISYSVDNPDVFIADMIEEYHDKVQDENGMISERHILPHAILECAKFAKRVRQYMAYFRGKCECNDSGVAFSDIFDADLEHVLYEFSLVCDLFGGYEARKMYMRQLRRVTASFDIVVEEIKKIFPSEELKAFEEAVNYFTFAFLYADDERDSKLDLTKEHVDKLRRAAAALVKNIALNEREFNLKRNQERFAKSQGAAKQKGDTMPDFKKRIDEANAEITARLKQTLKQMTAGDRFTTEEVGAFMRMGVAEVQGLLEDKLMPVLLEATKAIDDEAIDEVEDYDESEPWCVLEDICETWLTRIGQEQFIPNAKEKIDELSRSLACGKMWYDIDLGKPIRVPDQFLEVWNMIDPENLKKDKGHDVQSLKKGAKESEIGEEKRFKTAEEAIQFFRERDRREEDEYIERIRTTLEKNWVILAGDNKEVEGKPKGYGVLESIAELLSSDIAALSNGKVSAPLSCGEWQRVLPDAITFPYDHVEYYLPADEDDPDSYPVTLASGEEVLIGRNFQPHALFTSVDKVRDLTLQFLTDALKFAQSIDSKSCDMWVDAIGCFQRVNHAFRIPKSRDLLDKMVQLMIDATTKLDVEIKFAHRESFRNGDFDQKRKVNKTSKSIPCLRRLNEIVVQYYDRKSGKVTGGLLHCDGFKSVIAELKVGGWTNDYNVSREEAEEATDLWMDIRFNLIDYISSLKQDAPLDKIKRGLENGDNHSFLKGFGTKDTESRPNESLIKEFGFILREIEQEPFDEMPLTDSQKEQAAEERARGQLGGQIKAATESVVERILPPIQKIVELSQENVMTNKKILSIEEERLDDDGKGGQNRGLTDKEEMIVKAIEWLKNHQPPRKSSNAAADAVYTIQETLGKWTKGYKRPSDEKKNEDPFVRTITNRRNALPEPV